MGPEPGKETNFEEEKSWRRLKHLRKRAFGFRLRVSICHCLNNKALANGGVIVPLGVSLNQIFVQTTLYALCPLYHSAADLSLPASLHLVGRSDTIPRGRFCDVAQRCTDVGLSYGR